MRRTHYIRERTKLETRAQELRTELDSVLKKIAALDLVWTEIFSQENGQSLPASTAGQDDEHGDESKLNVLSAGSEGQAVTPTNGAMGRLIETLAIQYQCDFKVRDIEQKILLLHPSAIIDRTTIASRLKKLVDERKLELIEQGKGRKASVFRSKPHEEMAAS